MLENRKNYEIEKRVTTGLYKNVLTKIFKASLKERRGFQNKNLNAAARGWERDDHKYEKDLHKIVGGIAYCGGYVYFYRIM